MSGRDGDPRVSHPNGDPFEMPADLAAVQADDALLDLLGSTDRMPGEIDRPLGGVDGELVRVLTAWRREVHADSIRELVDTETALAAMNAARRPARRRSPVFAPVAAAAAVLVIAFSSVGLLAKSAHPGDNLWGVTQMLYSDYARSVEAAAFVQAELEEARTALREGKPEQAKASLDRIQQRLPVIAEAEGRTDLTARHHELERELDAGPPGQDPPLGSPDSNSEGQPAVPESLTSSASTPSVDPDSSAESDSSTVPEASTQPDSSTKPDSSTDADPSADTDPSTEPSTSTEPNPRTGPNKPSSGQNGLPRPTRPNQPPARPSPPDVTPPSSPSRPPSMGRHTDRTPNGPGDQDPRDYRTGRPGGTAVPPSRSNRPVADSGQPPFSARTASVYPRQYSQLT